MPSPNRKLKMTPTRMMLSAFCHLSCIRWTIFTQSLELEVQERTSFLASSYGNSTFIYLMIIVFRLALAQRMAAASQLKQQLSPLEKTNVPESVLTNRTHGLRLCGYCILASTPGRCLQGPGSIKDCLE